MVKKFYVSALFAVILTLLFTVCFVSLDKATSESIPAEAATSISTASTLSSAIRGGTGSYVLTNNIIWSGCGYNEGNTFSGTLDGAGYTITLNTGTNDRQTTGDNKNIGIMVAVMSGTISNCTIVLENHPYLFEYCTSTKNYTNYCGVICGQLYGVINNVHIIVNGSLSYFADDQNDKDGGYGIQLGAFGGKSENGAQILNSSVTVNGALYGKAEDRDGNNDEGTSSRGHVGGFVGESFDSLTITNCALYGSSSGLIAAGAESGDGDHQSDRAGGVIGVIRTSSSVTINGFIYDFNGGVSVFRNNGDCGLFVGKVYGSLSASNIVKSNTCTGFSFDNNTNAERCTSIASIGSSGVPGLSGNTLIQGAGYAITTASVGSGNGTITNSVLYSGYAYLGSSASSAYGTFKITSIDSSGNYAATLSPTSSYMPSSVKYGSTYNNLYTTYRASGTACSVTGMPKANTEFQGYVFNTVNLTLNASYSGKTYDGSGSIFTVYPGIANAVFQNGVYLYSSGGAGATIGSANANTVTTNKNVGTYTCYLSNSSGTKLAAKTFLYANTINAPTSVCYYDSQSYTLAISQRQASVTWTNTSLTYNAAGQLPTATVNNLISGDSCSVTLSESATNAGSYTAGITALGNANYSLPAVKTQSFTIDKATSTITPPSAQTIKYGQSLSTNLPDGSAKNGTLNVDGTFSWTDGALIPAIGTNSYSAFFAATDTANYYSPIAYSVSVTTSREYSIKAIDFCNSAGVESRVEARNTVSFNDALTIPVNSNHSAQVSVTASPYVNGNYVFAGWKRNGVYQTLDLTYTYTMPDGSETEYKAELIAVFLKIDVDGLEYQGNSTYKYEKPFSGEVSVFSFEFSLELKTYGLEKTDLLYVGGGVFPIAVGQKAATFTIRNNDLTTDNIVLSAIINFEITESIVAYEVSNRSVGYNQVTGWGETIYYKLTVPGASQNTVQYYMYQIEGETDWHIIDNVYDRETPPLPTAPQINQAGCPVLFKAGAAAAGESRVVKYLFKAISSEYGTTVNAPPGHKSVATSSELAVCKLDKVTPVLSVQMMKDGTVYDGSWVNTDITFVFTATYGASGAQILYSNNSSGPFIDTDCGPLLNYGDSAVITTGGTFSWTITAEQMSKGYYFRIVTGTNKLIDKSEPYILKIDKTAPSIGDANLDKPYNANGWLGETSYANFVVSDTLDYSGVASISVNPNVAFSVNSGTGMNLVTNNCRLYVADYRIYTVSATDKAGNISTREFRFQVDTATPALSLEADSYTADVWINGSADFNILAAMGASGAKFYYKLGTQNYILIGGDNFIQEPGAATQPFQNVRQTLSISTEMNTLLTLRVVTASGLQTELQVGSVKIDQTVPIIAPITSLQGYQGEIWYSTPILVDFYVNDGASGVDVARVTLSNGGTVTPNGTNQNGYPKFSIQIDKCTDYLVRAYDTAGNYQEYVFQANIDIGIPSMTFEAFVGSTSEAYAFDRWINRTTYGDDAYVRFVFDMTISPSGAKIQYMDSSNIWKDLTDLLHEEGHENDFEQHVVESVDIKTDQNSPFRIRLITGSGKTTDIQILGTIMIDSTLPFFSSAPAFTNAVNVNEVLSGFQTEWTNKVVKARFVPSDATSGITAVTVMRFAVDDLSFQNGEEIDCEKETATIYYSFLMDRYARYRLMLSDGSGNSNFYPVITAMVDITGGFSLDVSAVKDGLPFVSGEWMYDAGDTVEFGLEVTFASGSGYTSFGESGGWMEFSVDGGATWRTEIDLPEGTQSLLPDSVDPLAASMTITLQQVKTYIFRARTGAGNTTPASAPYVVLKDTVSPEIAYLAKANSISYEGAWTAYDVVFTFTVSVGASNGYVQQLVSAEPITDLTAVGYESQWTNAVAVTQGIGTEYTYRLSSTVESVYYYFRIKAGAGYKATASQGSFVRIDKTVVVPTFGLYSGETLYTGGWFGSSLQARLNTLGHIPSGYSVYFGTASIGGSVFTYIPLQSGIYNLDSSGSGDVRFRITNGAGAEFYSAAQTYRIDIIMPTFNIEYKGMPRDEFEPASQDEVWYLGDVNVLFSSILNGASGYTAQYSIQTGGVWSGWTSEGIASNEVIFRDESLSGGTVRNIRYRVLSGAGLYEINEYPLYIDDNIYNINVTQYVGNTEGNYAANVNGIQDVQRGSDVIITFGNAEGYRIKMISVNGAYYAITGTDETDSISNQDYDFTPMFSGAYDCDYREIYLTGDEQIMITAGGSDVDVKLYFIKDIRLAYSNLEQTLQNNTVSPIVIAVDEYGFNTTYAAESLGFDVLYNGSTQIPQYIGVYAITVITDSEDFNIVNPDSFKRGEETIDLELCIRYFGNSGNIYNPYIIYSYTDITYLNDYMNTSEEYNYLGQQRIGSVFRLDQDIELPSDFLPLCAREDNAFQGSLYGQGYKIYSSGVNTVSGDFGLLGKARNAIFIGLGIEMNIQATAEAGQTVRVGLFAAQATDVSVGNSYVYGEISLFGPGSFEAGGLFGEVTNGMVINCFSDVQMSVKNAIGYFGGIAGGIHSEIKGVNGFGGCYSVGQIYIDDFDIGAVRGTDYYVGSYVGWLEQPFDNQLIAQMEMLLNGSAVNNYLAGSVTVRGKSGGISYTQSMDIGIGNEGSIAYEYSVVRPYSFFLGADAYIGDGDLPINESLYAYSLSRMRIRDAGFEDAEGTESSPFIVNTAAKLLSVNVFPWAVFEQSTNIVYPAGAGSLADKIPFAGVYDGNNHSLICSGVTTDGNYGGMFALVYGGVIKDLKILGITMTFSAAADIYIGAVAGYAINALFDNIVATGTIAIEATGHTVYVGGIAGAFSSSEMSDCVSMINISVNNASNAYVGGIIAQAQGATTISNVVSLSRISVNFTKNGYIGATIGYTYDQGVTGDKLYNVEGSTYVNGRLYSASVGSNQGNVQEVYNRSYNDTVSAANGVTMGTQSILELISSLYPFESGTGTSSDPFRVATYQQLLKIGNYMYANFKLTNDIVIGDVDGDLNNNGVADGREPGGVRHPDGVVDAFDGYDYSFTSIGKGVAFTGSLTGAKSGGGEYYISGLTAPLFEINNGTVNNLTLNVAYRQYTSQEDVPVGIQGCKVDNSGADVVYGGLAKYNYANGKVNSVTVAGTVIIETAGKAKIKAGGIIGVMYGGTIRGSLNAVDMTLSSLLIDAGGIAGTLEGNATILDSASGPYTLNYNYTVATIRASGGSVKAGLIVGAVRYHNVSLSVTAADTSARVYINGLDKGSNLLVGYSII